MTKKQIEELRKIDELKPIISDEVLIKNRQETLKRDAETRKQTKKSYVMDVLRVFFVGLTIAFLISVIETASPFSLILAGYVFGYTLGGF